jgi:hypothetical protein
MIASQVYHQTGEDTRSMSRIGLVVLCIGISQCLAQSILHSEAAAKGVLCLRILLCLISSGLYLHSRIC